MNVKMKIALWISVLIVIVTGGIIGQFSYDMENAVILTCGLVLGFAVSAIIIIVVGNSAFKGVI